MFDVHRCLELRDAGELHFSGRLAVQRVRVWALSLVREPGSRGHVPAVLGGRELCRHADVYVGLEQRLQSMPLGLLAEHGYADGVHRVYGSHRLYFIADLHHRGGFDVHGVRVRSLSLRRAELVPNVRRGCALHERADVHQRRHFAVHVV